MKRKKYLKVVFYSFACAALTGCVNPPREVRASMPLVDKKVNMLAVQGNEVPLFYWQYLSNPNQTSVTRNKFHYQLSTIYTSALTVLCRKIMLSGVEGISSQSRIVCTNSSHQDLTELSAWYLVPDIKGANKTFPL
jgi:hypothetical protein